MFRDIDLSPTGTKIYVFAARRVSPDAIECVPFRDSATYMNIPA
jgi:hypothetical protein